MRKKQIVVVVIFLVLAGVCLLLFLNHRGKINDQKAFYGWTSSISAEDIQLSNAYDWDREEGMELSQGQLEELLRLLNDVPLESIQEGDGGAGAGHSSIMLQTVNGSEYLLKYSDGIIYFTFDTDTAALYGNRAWEIDDLSLAAYFTGLFS